MGITALLAGGTVVVVPPPLPMGVTKRIALPVLLGELGGERWDTIAMVTRPIDLFIPKVGNWAYQPIPMSPLVAIAGDGRGVALAEWSDREPGAVRVRLLDASGSERWQRTIQTPARRISGSVRDSLLDAGVEMARPQLKSAQQRGVALGGSPRRLVERGLFLPRFFAPARRILIGVDGSVWLEELAGLQGGAWLVLDENGGARFRVRAPDSLRIEAASLASVWGVEVDDLGVAYLVRLRVEDG